MNTKSAQVTRTTTAQLKVGDIIQHGNIFDGFIFTTVVELNDSTWNRMRQVLEKFEHGGIAGNYYGKNMIWFVVQEAK
jgi:hypothetical protein